MSAVKKITISTILVTISWMLMDMIFHGQLLHNMYESTRDVWRPMAEMNMTLSIIIQIAFSLLFVIFYNVLTETKTLVSGGTFGFYTGAVLGISSSSMYLYLPIPYALATCWLAVSLFEGILAGFIVGFVCKD